MTEEKIFRAFYILSILAEANDLRRDANELLSKICGNCVNWMKLKQCPREKPADLSGFQKGPSCNELACGKFDIQPQLISLYQQRLDEANKILKKIEGIGEFNER